MSTPPILQASRLMPRSNGSPPIARSNTRINRAMITADFFPFCFPFESCRARISLLVYQQVIPTNVSPKQAMTSDETANQ